MSISTFVMDLEMNYASLILSLTSEQAWGILLETIKASATAAYILFYSRFRFNIQSNSVLYLDIATSEQSWGTCLKTNLP